MVLRSQEIPAGSETLVVPPFECAWLGDMISLDDAHHSFPANSRCVEFAVRGTNDATVLLTPYKGSNRLETGRSYCVIFGSNRNQCLRIERNGEYRASIAAPWTKLSPWEYNRYWVNYQGGTFHVGVGEYGKDSSLFSWTDNEKAIEGTLHVGFSSWDTHLSYKEIRIRTEGIYDYSKGKLGMGSNTNNFASSLFESCLKALEDGLTEEKALRVMPVLAGKVLPDAEPLWRKLIIEVARGFENVAVHHVNLFSLLPPDLVTMVLSSPELVSGILNLIPSPELLNQLPSMRVAWPELNRFSMERMLNALKSAHWDEILGVVIYWSFYGQEPSMAANLRDEEDIVTALKLIRFHFINDKVLESVLDSPLAKRVKDLPTMVKEGKAIKEDMLDGMEKLRSVGNVSGLCHTTIAKLQPHARQQSDKLVFQYCGDHYGACHNLGTKFGKHPWVNPVVLKAIAVKTSSPPGRCTIPKEIVGDRFLTSSYSGPKYENGSAHSWWSIDFGTRKLICTHYTIRHDASDAYLRAWSLQGSNNGVEWVDLRRHINDFTIKSKGEWGAWPVHTDRSYQMFRLLQTGPNASATNPDHFCLSSVEFYGILLTKSNGQPLTI